MKGEELRVCCSASSFFFYTQTQVTMAMQAAKRANVSLPESAGVLSEYYNEEHELG